MAEAGARRFPVRRVTGGETRDDTDALAVEEPLEIRVAESGAARPSERVVAVTLRTPGHDAELAAGFLFTEGVLARPEDIEDIATDAARGTVRVTLRAGVAIDWARLERHSFLNSSCGACGKKSVAALRAAAPYALPTDGPRILAHTVHGLPGTLRRAQSVFESTGGLHAAALFTPGGELVSVYEDVGRHNALDKLIGAAVREKRLPLSENLLLVSGRASFELVQKARMAGLPLLAAVGAPSSLAVELARASGMTLLGFVRDARFNAYAGAWRVSELL